jgi:uncharacterized phage protein gp47/JayE
MPGDGMTDAGFVSQTFQETRDEVDDYQKQEISAGLDLSDDSPDGIVNASICLQLAKLWETLEGLVADFDPAQATEWMLEQLAAITGTIKTKYSYTLVTGQVTMDANYALPAGSAANLTGKPNYRFLTATEVPSDPSGGTFDVVFVAELPGEITVAIGELSEINVVESGWTAVDNAAVQTYTGTEPEDDTAFRAKRIRELAASGSGTFDASRANVSQVDGGTYQAPKIQQRPLLGSYPHTLSTSLSVVVPMRMSPRPFSLRGPGEARGR